MTLIPGGETSIIIDGAVGSIEIVSMMPKSGLATDVVVICHPHSQMGGSLHNKVVHTIARAHRDAAHLAIRFNFRGVGKSAGEYDGGMGEGDDLGAVVRWARQEHPQGRLFLAGFSFGAFVLARSLASLQKAGHEVHHILLVAPPVHHFEFQSLTDFAAPLTVVMGECDEVVPPDDVFRWFDTVISAKRLVRIPGAGHFFHGMLQDVKSAVENDIR